jgi:hypothetical protein
VTLDDGRRDLLERFLDESIPEAEAERLLGLLDADPAFRAEFVAALRMRGLLHAAHEPETSARRLAEVVGLAVEVGGAGLGERVMERIEGRGRKTRWAVAIAAAWLIGIVLWIVLRPSPALRVVAAGEGATVERAGASLAAAPGLALREADVVRAPAEGWVSLAWEDGTSIELGPDSALVLENRPERCKRVRLERGRLSADVSPQPPGDFMVLRSRHAEARVLGTSLSLAVTTSDTRLVVRSGNVSFGGGADAIEVGASQAATAAEGRPPARESLGRELLRRLGKNRFLLGVMGELAETWVADVRAQGARMDARYQHLSWDWTRWNKDGGFVPLYLAESERQGVLTVFTYFALSQPAKGPEGRAAVRAVQPETMKRYFQDLLLFMKRAGEHGKPLILHVEPDVWGELLAPSDAAPREPGAVRVLVEATGLPELAGLGDTLVSFGKAFSRFRDRLAPNVLLAWHASKRPGLGGRASASALLACGAWDFAFTDVGDRDAGFREARGEKGVRWSERDFAGFRDWAAELHAASGLPLVLWRIPLGNTVMAACNDTAWHYTDNRAEYFLEGYPANRRIAEWAQAGFVGLLFGGGTIGCTVHRDNAKDGVTNPPPIPGNRGETSVFPDDDGGYLRLRSAAYYRSGPLPLFAD